MNDIATALKDWVPYKLSESNNDRFCRWLYLGSNTLTDPFFDDTISRCRNLAENSKLLKCVSSVEILPEWAGQVDGLDPTAIIFHISRCGSTLISQLLAQQPGNIVLSEVPFIDELLRGGKKKHELQAALPLVKAAINLYGARRSQEAARLFIKADSWHIHFYKELRQLYPGVPFILLYRRPDEVLRSQQKKRGMQAVPGVIEPDVFGFDSSVITSCTLDEYMAKVMESYLRAFLEISEHDTHTLLVNYNQGGLAIVETIAALTNTPISETELKAMQERSGFHAKNPGDVFTEPGIEEPPYPFLAPAFSYYDKLEKLRVEKNVNLHH